MNKEQKDQYQKKYKQEKDKGVKFWPDIIYKDLLISFALFLILILLATFVGIAREPKADPNDSSYIPRPEWYFLFLFEFLKFIPGKIEWVGTVIIPGIGVLALFLLPFFDKNPNRFWKKRKIAISVMTIIVIGIVGLTIRAVATTPPQEETTVAGSISEQIIFGQDGYSFYCVECHGADGEGGEIIGVEGLEGIVLKPINSQDEMYTRTDETMYNIIDYGQQDLGMPPFGLGYGGELSKGDIDTIVTFMRYTWDDRAEIPEDAALASAVPALLPGEVPSYEVHISAIIKRYCISCHREGKENNNYFMTSYEETINSGDNAPNVIALDLFNNTIRVLHREEIEEIGGAMPPTKALKDEYIHMFELWVETGLIETALEAEALSSTETPLDSTVIDATSADTYPAPMEEPIPTPLGSTYPSP